MKSWKTDKAMYCIVETSKKGKREHFVIMTGEEVARFCKGKMDMHGYIAGLGGDRSYSCVATLADY